MKLPALLIAGFVAAGVLAASPIAVHTRHSLDLSLGVALFCIIAGFGLVRFRGANLAWAASLLASFSLPRRRKSSGWRSPRIKSRIWSVRADWS